ncbi:hypothetical protein AB1Y20_011867 [Prymnesium parvum]|uniref:DUF7796 domain-containing protein n=1 Tax=Prymnesium parvum TaxID=97485 RepID=A0AB34IKC2_PRYPA
MRHAVCLTGMERSFSEIGWNIHEAVHHLLRTPNASVHFFGVRPANDSWKYVRSWFAFEEISLQRYCTVPVPRWYGCQEHGRTDCRHSFVQELCDLDQCEAMLCVYERQHGAEFHTVMRLRADVYWEARVNFPRGLRPDEVVVPFMESGSGLNDHVAFGGRKGMRVFLTRVHQLHQNITKEDLRILALPRGQKRLLIFSELFLKLALARQRVKYRVIREWMYCLHTKRALLDQRGVYGCIARARARRRCGSLMCAKSNVKYWCLCLNATCATVDAGVPVASLGPAHIQNRAREYNHHRGAACVDVQHSQLLHPGCPWRSHDYSLSYPGVMPLTWPVLPRNASRNTELQNCPQEGLPRNLCLQWTPCAVRGTRTQQLMLLHLDIVSPKDSYAPTPSSWVLTI